MQPDHANHIPTNGRGDPDEHPSANQADRSATLDGAGSPAPSTNGPPEALSGGWLVGAWALVAGALALAAGGFVNSFSAVRDALEPSFGELAWTVPVLIDVGIAVFSGIDLLFTRLGMRLRWLRLVPWTLNAATIWLNVADEQTSIGVVAHAAPPVLWIVTVELAGHFLRARAGMESNPGSHRAAGRMDHVRLSRWILSPWSTLVIRRWMILQEERSYEIANARWWARKEAKWELQDDYGVLLWRVRAPRKVRGRYRHGHLNPTTEEQAGAPLPPEAEADAPTRSEDQEPPTPRRRRAPHGDPARPTPGDRRRAGIDDVRRIAARLTAEGQPVNRTLVTRRLRAEGLSLANDRADQYLAELQAGDDSQGDRQVA